MKREVRNYNKHLDVKEAIYRLEELMYEMENRIIYKLDDDEEAADNE